MIMLTPRSLALGNVCPGAASLCAPYRVPRLLEVDSLAWLLGVAPRVISGIAQPHTTKPGCGTLYGGFSRQHTGYTT